jgi:flagellar basal-body rod protein FlgF
MTIPGIIRTARTLTYYERLQEMTANNLANVSSEGFKADRMTARLEAGAATPTPVTQMDLSQGSFRETGRPLDLALDGQGFFVVRTARGERLTRGGGFRLDGTGTLTDQHGDPVLGRRGPVVITGGTVEVRADGTVVVDGQPVDTLRLETVANAATLRKEGGNQLSTQGATKPADAASLRVRQGAIEESNLDAIHGMVDLVTIQRAYTANINVLRAMDGVLGTVANDLARP